MAIPRLITGAGTYGRLAASVLALRGYFLRAVHAYAASMPPELMGEWAHRTDYCGNGELYITRSGFSGLDSGEGWGCDLKSIRRPDLSFETWTIEASCSGENPKKVTTTSIFSLGEFEGGDLLIVVNLVNNRTEVM